jgi:hypothetical protein
MVLKEVINKSVCGAMGYISSQEDLDTLEQYIVYNMSVLKEFKQVIIATNYGSPLQNENSNLWKKYFPNCILLDSKLNRGHNHGYTDLENSIFDWCKENNKEWLCKISNDVIIQETILEKKIEEADFYYLNGISYETLYLNNFDYKQIYDKHFYPQGNFYFIDISKCDFISDKTYLDETYEYIKTIPNYNGKIWEYVKGWSCEDFLKNCVERNNLSKFYLLDEFTHNKLCNAIKLNQIGDPSHKNIMIEGICHFQFPNHPVIEI